MAFLVCKAGRLVFFFRMMGGNSNILASAFFFTLETGPRVAFVCGVEKESVFLVLYRDLRKPRMFRMRTIENSCTVWSYLMIS